MFVLSSDYKAKNMNRSSDVYQLMFPRELQSMLETGRAHGRSGKRFDGLGALSSLNNLVILRNLLVREAPKRTLEVGLSFGGSAIVFASYHRDVSHDPAGQHLALDPFQTSVWDDAGLVALERAGLDGFVSFVQDFSALELPNQLRSGKSVDLAYIDGSHLFEDVFIDFFYVSRLLNTGGLVVFDDCSDPNVSKVLRFIRRNLASSFCEVDLSGFRSDGGRSVRYKLAKAVGRVQMRAYRKVANVEREWCASFRAF